MKNRKKRIFLTIAVTLAGYLLIAFIGLSIMISSSMKTQRPAYLTGPVEVQSREGWEEELLAEFGRIAGTVQMFDRKGRLLIDTYQIDMQSGIEDPMGYYYPCDRFVDKVRDGKTITEFSVVYDKTQKTLRVVYIYGAPAVYDGETAGEIFGVHSPLYFSRTLQVFLIFFSAAYIIAAASVIIVIAMRRRYEEARQRYVDNVTHALKTPVTSIKALAETLYDGAETDPEEQKYDLQLILHQADLQVDMVRNILSLSHIQTNGMKLKKEKVNAKELILDPVKKHLPECELKKITLTVSDAVEELPGLLTDPDAIRQVIDVILDNSVKFTPEGGCITIDAKTAGRRSVIAIRDNGIGISKDQISKIFDRFYTSSIGNAEGNGLGLAIAGELIHNLREKIWAESEPGQGTVISFTVANSK